MSHPVVRPFEISDEAALVDTPQGVAMRDLAGRPGTAVGLLLRAIQFVFGCSGLIVMLQTSDLKTILALRFFVFAVFFQILWSMAMGSIDVCALLQKRKFRAPCVILMSVIGDAIMTALVLGGTCTSLEVFVYSNERSLCAVNACRIYLTGGIMALISFATMLASCLSGLWLLWQLL